MRRVGGLLVLACASACDGGAPGFDLEPAATTQALQAAPFGRPGTSALDEVRHAGLRLVEFFDRDGARLAYRERIVTDGQGRFSIEFQELVEGQGLDPDLFQLLQQSSQGFLYRYRDFAIRSSERFDRNYSWSIREDAPSVAGRSCRRIEISCSGSPRNSYDLELDRETGIVLASEERDAAGRVVHAVTYESLDLDPKLEGVEWHSAVNREQALDAHAGLAEQLGVAVLEPRLLPDGYAWSEAATVADGLSRPWLKLVYTDGIRPLLFLQRLPEAPDGPGEPGLEGGTGAALIGPGVASAADRVTVYEMGAVTVAQGTVAGVDVIALGRVAESELLDLIESALP